MHDTITIPHGLASFDVLQDPRAVTGVNGQQMVLTVGRITEELPRVCPECGGEMDVHQEHETTIKHVPIQLRPHLLKVLRKRVKCRRCGKLHMQSIPFKDEDHRITKHMRKLVEKRMGLGNTIKAVSRDLGLHPTIIKEIDKKRLQKMFPTKAPKEYAKHIAIDEFLLHRGHHYATVVLDIETGNIIWCSEGKKKQQVYDFTNDMGEDWMSRVKAVSMDMNAQYSSAFKELYPSIAVIYDKFHMVKLYNDRVLTSMRRRKQNELAEQGDEEGYQLYKGSRYIVLSDRRTLQEKDRKAKENNRLLDTMTLRGAKWPAGARKMCASNETKLDDLLAVNAELSKAYFLLDQFKAAFDEKDPSSLFWGLRRWLDMAFSSGVPEIITFAKTVRKRIRSLVCHALFPINSGKLEGTNNMIKTVRRQAYGFRDTEYFFLKIMEASRKRYWTYKSHRILN